MFVDSSAIKIVQDTITVTRAEMIDQARAGTRLMAASVRRTEHVRHRRIHSRGATDRMTVDFPYDYYVYLDPRSPTGRIHDMDCPVVRKVKGSAGWDSTDPYRRRLNEGAKHWRGPFGDFDDAEQAILEDGERSVRLCRMCEPDPDPCDPDSHENYIRRRRGETPAVVV